MALLLTLALGAGVELRANQLPGEMVTGQVTAVSGNSQITVDGKSYRIKSGSAAAAAARSAVRGQTVDIQLNGPANSSASEVINLVTRATR